MEKRAKKPEIALEGHDQRSLQKNTDEKPGEADRITFLPEKDNVSERNRKQEKDRRDSSGTRTGSLGRLVRKELADVALETSLEDLRHKKSEIEARVALGLERVWVPAEVVDDAIDGFIMIPPKTPEVPEDDSDEWVDVGNK